MGFFSKLFGDDSPKPPPMRGHHIGAVRRMGAPLLDVEDVFTITGRGIVVTGRLQQPLDVGEILEVTTTHDAPMQFPEGARVAGIEQFRTTLQSAQTGDNVGVLLSPLHLP